MLGLDHIPSKIATMTETIFDDGLLKVLLKALVVTYSLCQTRILDLIRDS